MKENNKRIKTNETVEVVTHGIFNKIKNTNTLKLNQAVTLVALIITVIVLLILAGITLNMVLGDNGIIKRALEAKEKTQLAQQNETKQYEELLKYLGSTRDLDEKEIAKLISDAIDKKLSEAGSTTPTGNVIAQMGKSAPSGYLNCDGATYNISEYQKLADYIKEQFGSYNYFGGDGTETFAVPDLRGEFLRGTGTANRNKGAGGEVGTHQDPTYIPNIMADQDRLEYISASTANDGKGECRNGDSIYNSSTSRQYRLGGVSSLWSSNISSNTHYAVRPTNMSVLYCIKY